MKSGASKNKLTKQDDLQLYVSGTFRSYMLVELEPLCRHERVIRHQRMRQGTSVQ